MQGQCSFVTRPQASGGVAVMVWSVARILRELAQQGPEMQAKYDAYLAARKRD